LPGLEAANGPVGCALSVVDRYRPVSFPTAVTRRAVVFAAIALALAFALDHWAFANVVDARVYERDWGRLLRILGFWPTWVIAAGAMWLQERGVVGLAKRRALLLVGAPALSGVAAEVLKLAFRRLRPLASDGEYAFRALSDGTFSTRGLAFPSSHAMVAFGAAAILAYLYPRARWVWFTLAAGCALTRVLARAHYLSDVVAAAIAAVAITAWLVRRVRGPTVSVTPEFPAAG
jgi:membrane-associated phospholipid phosphatase